MSNERTQMANRKLKVYGCSRGYARKIVAATSKTAAARLLNLSMYSANLYLSETGNAEELKIAFAKPGVVFENPHSAANPDHGTYREALPSRTRY